MPKAPTLKIQVNQILETLADLGEAMGKGFENVGKELAKLDGKLDRFENALRSDGKRIEQLEQKAGII